MKGVFSRDGETFTSSMSLIVSLLIRYPEIATLKLNPADSSLVFSFILQQKLSVEEKQAFRKELKMSLETLALLDQIEPEIIELSFKRQGALTFLEIKRDIASFSPDELSLTIRIINDRYGDKVVKEEESEAGEEDLLFQEEMIAHMLEELKEVPQKKELTGIREEGRVLIFNHSDPP
ncbi:MAG: hypothetical protein GX202_01640 [Firmicutes bacterium]|mgnify:CR=1 FL=1|nr:hypothetical protein [Bacillota bacterium]